MSTVGCQEAYIPKLKQDLQALPTAFQAKIRQAGWTDYIFCNPMYYDPQLMDQILLALKASNGKAKLDAGIVHTITGLPKEGEVPLGTKRSEVDREMWMRKLCHPNTQIMSGGIRVADIMDVKLQWVAKVINSRFLSKRKYTYIQGGMMQVLLQIRDGERMNWSEFLAENMRQQLQEIRTQPFRHPSLLLAILFYQCPDVQLTRTTISPREPIIKQWVAEFPDSTTSMELKRRIQKQMQKVLTWLQKTPGTPIPHRTKQAVHRRGKRKKGEEESEEEKEEEAEASWGEWEDFPAAEEVGEPSAPPTPQDKAGPIIKMIQDMEVGYKAEIAALQEKIKEKDAIIATLTQINEEILGQPRPQEPP